MRNLLIDIPAKYLMGKGIDKQFPFLVDLYKRFYLFTAANGETEIGIPLNQKLLVSNKDSGLGLFLRIKGEFEPLQTKLFLKTVKKGDCVLDIGANMGYYSILSSELVGKTGRVFSFEPEKESYRLLLKNIDLNSCKNIVPQEVALGSKKGKVNFYKDLSNPGESSLREEKGLKRVLVEMVELDGYLRKGTISKVDVINLDVEGAEIDVLRGAEKLIKASKSVKIFIECNPETLKKFGKKADDLINTLEEQGLTPKLIINDCLKKVQKYTKSDLEENLNNTTYVSIYAEK